MTSPSDDNTDNLVEQALNLFVYVPLGLALEARDLLPKLADRGRGQVVMARLAGRYAAQQRQQKAAREAERNAPTEAGVETNNDDATSEAQPETEAEVVPTSDALPIDGYDTLSANQILPLLAGLDNDDLQAVWAFEQAHRGRVTVTNRIDKLLR